MRPGGRDDRWWLASEDDVAKAVLRTVQRVHEADEERRRCLERSARLYGPGLGLGRWQGEAGRFGALSMNVVRALAQTASASLLQTAPPRPWFVTDEGDWETQRRTKGMTRLATGALYRAGFDEQARGDTLLSASLGTAVSKILERDGEPIVERVLPWELLVDPRDGFDGKPRSLYQVAFVDREVLRGRYAEPSEPGDDQEDLDEEGSPELEAIDKAGGAGLLDDWEHDPDTTTDQVCVLEAWHLPSRKGAGDGRHVICTDKGTLLDERWEDDSFPFAFFRWTRPLTGFWAPGIGDEIWTLQYEINLVLERIRQMLHTVAVPRVWTEENSNISPGPLTNEIGARFYYRGAKPIFETARAVSPELWQYLEYLWSKAFQLLGISELAASAMKPGGIDSGKALRIYADLTSGRMRGWALAWQEYYLAVSEQLVALMRRLSKSRRGEISYLDRQTRRLERVRWADVALKEGSYAVECFPVSSLPETPSARIQMLDEWLNAGLIDQDQYRRLLDVPDLGAETKLLTAPRDVFEQAVEHMLFGTDEQAEAAHRPGENDNLKLWLRFGPLHLLRAEQAGVPAERRALLSSALVEAKTQLDDAAAAAAAAAGPPPGAMPPAGATPPGAEAMAQAA